MQTGFINSYHHVQQDHESHYSSFGHTDGVSITIALVLITVIQISGALQVVVNPRAKDANDAAEVDTELLAEQPGNLLTSPITVINRVHSLVSLHPPTPEYGTNNHIGIAKAQLSPSCDFEQVHINAWGIPLDWLLLGYYSIDHWRITLVIN